jgi:hypothetical protein
MTEFQNQPEQGQGSEQHPEDQRPGVDHVSQALDNQQKDDAEADRLSQPVPDNQ